MEEKNGRCEPFNKRKMKLKIVKKCLSAGIAVIFLCMCFTPAFAEVATVSLGDADRDGKIGAGDARQILRFSVGLDNPDLDDLNVCDVNGDGAIGSADARIILRVTVGIDDLNGKIVAVGENDPEPAEEPAPAEEEPQPAEEEPAPAEEEPQPVYEVDPNDQEMLAIVIAQEVGGLSMELKLMVGNVVINRVNHWLYPNTIYEVLTQPKQYSGICSRGFVWPRWMGEADKYECRVAAYRLLSGERVMPANVLFQSSQPFGDGIYAYYPTQWYPIYFCYTNL